MPKFRQRWKTKLEAITGLMLAIIVSLGAFLPITNPPSIALESEYEINTRHDLFQTTEDTVFPSDMLIAPDSPSVSLNADDPPSPGRYENSEYLIGDVAVGIILLESNGTIDPQTEDWTPTEEFEVISEIKTGLNWLASQNPSANVNFTLDIHYLVPTSYEPINRPHTDQWRWIGEAMTYLGYPGISYFTQVRDYINDLRDTKGTDWSYAMFIVDSSSDTDGAFANRRFAYSYFGGPFLVMTYDNDGWGIANMDRVTAHETCHIFYATDEWNGITEYSGYLNASDVEGSRGLMDNLSWNLSSGTGEQIGWRDTDGDGIHDIIDTFPDTTLNPYSPDPTTNTTLTYNGSVTVVPYPNNNPRGTGRNATINTITNVQFRVDGEPWINATPIDGAFDEAVENFTFTTPPLSAGTHTIETRGINSVDNIETSYASDTVFVTLTGDVNDDGTVDASDLFDLSKAYGSDPSKPNWNPNCDFNNDDKVDASDLLELSKNYGKTNSN